MKNALITGINGQDGSYLAELLLSKGYEVHGVVRRASLEAPEYYLNNVSHIADDIQLHPASIESFPEILRLISEIQPDEVYHLAAQSFVSYSFEDEFSTLNTNINGTHHLLAAIKEKTPHCHIYFAGSSEMFGDTETCPQNEKTPFRPRSAYGISKVAGYYLARNYRNQYGLFASCGILYNHESPRRARAFVTRKITRHAALIKLGLAQKLELGNIDAQRDWGHSKDYVQSMWMMLQHPQADDFVICSGQTHSVRDFAQLAFETVGLDYNDYVVINPKFNRPSEKVTLKGDASKARTVLGWEPTIKLKEIVEEMVESDLEAASEQK